MPEPITTSIALLVATFLALVTGITATGTLTQAKPKERKRQLAICKDLRGCSVDVREQVATDPELAGSAVENTASTNTAERACSRPELSTCKGKARCESSKRSSGKRPSTSSKPANIVTEAAFSPSSQGSESSESSSSSGGGSSDSSLSNGNGNDIGGLLGPVNSNIRSVFQNAAAEHTVRWRGTTQMRHELQVEFDKEEKQRHALHRDARIEKWLSDVVDSTASTAAGTRKPSPNMHVSSLNWEELDRQIGSASE